MRSRFNRIKDNVKTLAVTNPEIFINNNTLIMRYWEKFDQKKSIYDLGKATPSESITRAYRKLKERGEIEIPPELEKVKRDEEKKWRDLFSKRSEEDQLSLCLE